MRVAEIDGKKGPWKAEEDFVLMNHVNKYGPTDWSSIQSKGLLRRTGKSCRLRWINKLRPNLKNGCKFSLEEERVVIELQEQFGNTWARIASYLSGRTDNDVKNFWSSRKKRLARLQTSPSSYKPKKQNHHHHRNNSSNYYGEEEEDTQHALILLSQVGQSSYVDQSSDGLLEFMDPASSSCLMNCNHNMFDQDMDFPAAQFPIQLPFNDPVTTPLLPLPLSPESQELLARLENGGLMTGFWPEDGVGDAEMDMSTKMMMPLGNCCAAGESFFDDIPADMFDHIESVASKPIKLVNSGEQHETLNRL